MSHAPMPSRLDRHPMFHFFAAQAGSELARRKAEEQRLQIERKLMQTQKLESLGLLAGGIAHDFNNLLVGITGHASLARRKADHGSSLTPHLQEIETTAWRGAELMRQLLAYSGKGDFMTARCDLSTTVQQAHSLFAVSIPENVALRYQLTEELPRVEVDPTQIHQVVMNLVLNAAEAIGTETGEITITTGTLEPERAYLLDSAITPQGEMPSERYVFVEVADNGPGMDESIRARILDPFFTTKPSGRGLGLAAVQGIVRGHQGALRIESTPHERTVFRVLLPAVEETTAQGVSARAEPEPSTIHSGHRALIIDDDKRLLRVMAKMLQQLGFDVVEAADGRTAIDLVGKQRDSIDLVLLDMTMPGMNGEETYREIRQLAPAVPLVLMSGYAEREATDRFADKSIAGFLQKPFDLDGLQTLVARIFQPEAVDQRSP